MTKHLLRRGGLLLALALTAGCSSEEEARSAATVKIAPEILSRVTGLHFDAGDRIGLTVERTSGGVHAENRMLVYDGTAFTSSDLRWYDDSAESAVLTACYPYSEAGMPTRFRVAEDQRQGLEPSDLLVAVKRDVRPSTATVVMQFRHLLAQLCIVVSNNSGSPVERLAVSGTAAEADIDLGSQSAAAAEGATATILAFEDTPDTRFSAILVPGRADLQVRATTRDGREYLRSVPATELLGGKRYELYVELGAGGMYLALSGEIADWGEGGSLTGNTETPSQGSVAHEGETYPTQHIAGREWMAANLRHIPAGAVIGTGLWYPSEGAAGADKAGMLYDFATATEGAAARNGEPLRGICPPGWHIPCGEELAELLAAAPPASFFRCAGYWLVNGVSDKYSPQPYCYLMGASAGESEGQYLYLQYGPQGAVKVASVSGRNGVSLRCVKDETRP